LKPTHCPATVLATSSLDQSESGTSVYIDKYLIAAGTPMPESGKNMYKYEGIPQGSLSILEFTVSCPAKTPTEMVGVVISVDRVGVGGRTAQGIFDGLPRLHVEYATSKSGQMKYSWDGLDGKFVANRDPSGHGPA
jgi:hypothetical protein